MPNPAPTDRTTDVERPVPDDAAVPEETGVSSVAEPGEARAGRPRMLPGWLRGPRVLVLVAVLLLAVGGWFQWRTAELRTAPAVTNQALVDTAATDQVLGDVGDELNKVFSYAYDNTAVTEQAADDSLSGAAAGQYGKLFAQVRAHAAAQKLTLTTRTIAAGVTELHGDTASLLVFLDQTAVRGDTGAHSTSAAELAITAHRANGTWRITGIQSR